MLTRPHHPWDRLRITIAYPATPAGAFAFFGFASGAVSRADLDLHAVVVDADTLNRAMLDERYDVAGASLYACALGSHRYELLRHGAVLAASAGPWLAGRAPAGASDPLRRIGVSGTLSSAALALRLFDRSVALEIMPRREIPAAILARRVDAGLLEDHDRADADRAGLHRLVDLAAWWRLRTDLPMPLGGVVVRRSLSDDLRARLARLVLESIACAVRHREAAMRYARKFGAGPVSSAHMFDYGALGERAIRRFFEDGSAHGLLPGRARPDPTRRSRPASPSLAPGSEHDRPVTSGTWPFSSAWPQA